MLQLLGYFMKYILCVLMMLFSPISASSQRQTGVSSNKERAYVDSLYQVLYNNRSSKTAIALCDTIIKHSQKINYHGMVINAYITKTQRLWDMVPYTPQDVMRKEVRDMMDYSLKHNSLNGYFMGWNALISYYAFKRQYTNVLTELNNYRKEAAKKKGSEIFIADSYRLEGNFYYQYGMKTQAVANYQNAIRYANIYHQTRVSRYCWLMMARCYLSLKDYSNVISSCDSSIDISRKRNNDVYVDCNKKIKALAYYYMHNYDKMRELYGECKMKRWQDPSEKNYDFQLRALIQALDKKYDLAIVTCDSIPYERYRVETINEINVLRNDNKSTAASMMRLLDLKKQIIENSDSFRNQFSSLIINWKLSRKEYDRLKLERRKLQLRKALINDSIDFIQTSKQKIKRDVEFNVLETNKQETEQQALIEQQKTNAIQRELNAKRQINRSAWLGNIILSAASIIIIALIILLVIRRRLFLKKLKREKAIILQAKKEAVRLYQEASEAEQEAENLDKMKGVFLQNVSYNVRTPLNSVVGFSNLLTNADLEISETDKVEFSRQIEMNSKLLLTLVNNILDYANLSTGRYKLSYQQYGIEDVLGCVKNEEQLEIITDVSDTHGLFFLTDKARLAQAISILAVQTAHYSGSRKVFVKCYKSSHADSESLIVDVYNHDAVVDEVLAKEIIQNMNDINNVSEKNDLSLYLCRIIASVFGGSLTFSNLPGGINFIFEQPLTHNQTPTKQPNT